MKRTLHYLFSALEVIGAVIAVVGLWLAPGYVQLIAAGVMLVFVANVFELTSHFDGSDGYGPESDE